MQTQGRRSSWIIVLPLMSLVVAVTMIASAQTQHTANDTPAAGTAQPAIATGDYEVDGVEVALLSVKRISDGTLTVNWEYRNKTAEPKALGESFHGMGSSEAFSLDWDAYLVDARNRTKYPVVKDARGNPVASKHGGRKTVMLAPHQTIHTWAKFIAVPPEVKKISVFIPGVQPFEDVEISE